MTNDIRNFCAENHFYMFIFIERLNFTIKIVYTEFRPINYTKRLLLELV